MEKVGPKVAKLAKEYGFDNPCESYYGLKTNGEIDETECSGESFTNWNKSETLVSRPYQADLQTWIREELKFDVLVIKGEYVENIDLYAFRIPANQGGSFSSFHDTYEKALEAGFEFLFEVKLKKYEDE